jgi:hypothetical protein
MPFGLFGPIAVPSHHGMAPISLISCVEFELNHQLGLKLGAPYWRLGYLTGNKTERGACARAPGQLKSILVTGANENNSRSSSRPS